jgi:hypothetical protein
MSDSDSPDFPRKPSDLSGIFKPKPPPKEIPSHWLKDDTPDSPAQTPQADQEQLFRTAAIELAKEEEEILGLMEEVPFDESTEKIKNAWISSDTYILRNDLNGFFSIVSSEEKITGPDKDPRLLTFGDSVRKDARELGIDTNRSIRIYGHHSDEPTMEAFKYYEKTSPRRAKGASTEYYFTSEGEYKKVSWIPKNVDIDPTRHRLNRRDIRSWEASAFESQMTAGDFELAGVVLATLKNRLLHPEGSEPPKAA